MLRPGIGKTVLLRHLACRLDPQLFPDGIIYWSVGGRSYEDVLQALFELFYTTEIPYKPTRLRCSNTWRASRRSSSSTT